MLLNLILVPNPYFGVSGAAFATCACHAVAFIIGYKVLQKNIQLDINFSNFIVKPITATIMMSLCSYASFILINNILSEKLATIIAIIIAVIIYLVAIMVLKVIKKEEVLMLPMRRQNI